MLKITDFLPVARCPPAGWPGERRSGRLSAATSAACNLAFCFLIRFASAGASGAVRGKKMTLCIKLAGWVSLPKSTVHRQQPRLPVRCSHVRPKLVEISKDGCWVEGGGHKIDFFLSCQIWYYYFYNNRKKGNICVIYIYKLKDSSIQFINADQSEIFYSRSISWQQLNYSHRCEWQLGALISSTSAGPESSKNHYSSDSVSASLNAKKSNQSWSNRVKQDSLSLPVVVTSCSFSVLFSTDCAVVPTVIKSLSAGQKKKSYMAWKDGNTRFQSWLQLFSFTAGSKVKAPQPSALKGLKGSGPGVSLVNTSEAVTSREKNSSRGRSKNSETTSWGWTLRFSSAQMQSDTGDHHHDHQCQRRRRHGVAVSHEASITPSPPSAAQTSHSHTRDALVKTHTAAVAAPKK